MKTIHPSELKQMIERGDAPSMLDVRTPGEYRAVHVVGAHLVPLADLDARQVQQPGPIYVLCKSGGRARKAADQLTAAGVDAIVVEGGTEGCVSAGVAVIHGQRGLDLQRQSLLGAGLVVWTGLLLAWLVHPGFIALTAFAGCGLMAAGLLDICLMGLVLTRMPWNRLAGRGTTSANGTVACCSLKGAAS